MAPLLCAAAASLAALVTFAVGSSRVDMGIDLRAEPASTPRVGTLRTGELQVLAEMERIPDQFSPREVSFELVATGRKGEKAVGSEVWLLGFPDEFLLRQEPSGAWQEKPEAFVSAAPQPASISWTGVGPRHLTLLRHAWSGIATLKTPTGEQTLDLFDEKGNQLVVPLPSRPLPRYRASVPRRSLGALSVVLDDGVPVHRLFIGTLIPTVFFGSKPPDGVWGRVIGDWSPSRQHGIIHLDPLSPFERGGLATLRGGFRPRFAPAAHGVARGPRPVALRVFSSAPALARPASRPSAVSRLPAGRIGCRASILRTA